MISDEELQEMIETEGRDYAEPEQMIEAMATELLAYREEKRKAEEDRAKSWKGAPKWAQWKATDRDGVVFLYENKPIPCRGEWMPHTGEARIIKFVGPVLDWKDTLEERP